MSVLDVAAGSQAAAQEVKPGWIAVNVIIPEPMAVPGGTVRESISAAAAGCRRFVVEFSQTTPETTPPFDATAESSVKSIPRPWTAPPAGAARGPARDSKRFCRGDPVWMVAAVHTGPADDNWTPLSRADCKRLEEARANGEQTCRIEGGRKLVRSAIRSESSIAHAHARVLPLAGQLRRPKSQRHVLFGSGAAYRAWHVLLEDRLCKSHTLDGMRRRRARDLACTRRGSQPAAVSQSAQVVRAGTAD